MVNILEVSEPHPSSQIRGESPTPILGECPSPPPIQLTHTPPITVPNMHKWGKKFKIRQKCKYLNSVKSVTLLRNLVKGPGSQLFPPSGEQPEQRILAYEQNNQLPVSHYQLQNDFRGAKMSKSLFGQLCVYLMSCDADNRTCPRYLAEEYSSHLKKNEKYYPSKHADKHGWSYARTDG